MTLVPESFKLSALQLLSAIVADTFRRIISARLKPAFEEQSASELLVLDFIAGQGGAKRTEGLDH